MRMWALQAALLLIHAPNWRYTSIVKYYLRVDPKGRAPESQHRIAPNAHLTAPWPIELGWGASGDNLPATFMPRLCVYGRLMAPPRTGGATGIGR